MPDKFHVVFEKDDDWYIGYCPEVPGANGQGKTKEKCRKNVSWMRLSFYPATPSGRVAEGHSG